MNKTFIIVFIILFFLSALFVVFPPAGNYFGFSGVEKNPTQLFLVGTILTLVVGLLKIFYEKEYEKALKISHTPYAKYGWYTLIFFIIFVFLFYGYAFLSK